jgi:LysR family transcriptional activator of nhaA
MGGRLVHASQSDRGAAPTVEWLNYHHLLYFWMTAREGGVGAAARKLRLAQPTVSGQIRDLERSLGVDLLERDGRGVRLTPMGQRVFEHAEEIFALGDRIKQLAKGNADPEVARLVVGCADVLPKLVTLRLLQPALELGQPVHIVARQDRVDRLLGDLSMNALDVVLADTPLAASPRVRAFSHLLGESEIAIFAAAVLASSLREGFPRSMDGAPMLLPGAHTSLRRSLETWCEANAVVPRVVAEFDDSALLKAFASAGAGAFAAPVVVADELARAYGVEQVGPCNGLRERFYAITLERRIRNPAVAAISAAARNLLVAPQRGR